MITPDDTERSTSMNEVLVPTLSYLASLARDRLEWYRGRTDPHNEREEHLSAGRYAGCESSDLPDRSDRRSSERVTLKPLD